MMQCTRKKSEVTNHRQGYHAFQGNLNLRKTLQRETDTSKPTQAIAREDKSLRGKKKLSLRASKLMP